MRATKCIGLLLLTLTACPADDGGSADTGTGTDPSTTGMSTSTTTSPSGTATTATTSETDPMTGSSDSGSSTEPSTTGSSTEPTSSSSSSGGGEFIVTSPQFEQDGIIPSAHHSAGDNTMPQLDWTGAPGTAMSFAVLFRDLDFMMGFRHSAIWNISADAMGTPFDPEHVAMPADPAGSVQCRNWMGDFGYGGPGSESNTYEFEVYALDVADLSAEIDQDSSLIEVEAAFDAHVIESTTISGQTEGPP